MTLMWLVDLGFMFQKGALKTFNIWQDLLPFTSFQDTFIRMCFHLFLSMLFIF